MTSPTPSTNVSGEISSYDQENFLHPCKLVYGSLSNSKFDKDTICIVVPQNAVSCHNYGCTYDIVRKYSYANVAGLRRPCPVTKCYSVLEDRSPEGCIYIKSLPIYTNGPTVATLITQYGMGKHIEANDFARKLVKNCSDLTITPRLANDTLENRVSFFNTAMYKLAVQMRESEYDSIKHIIIPVGIGRRGRVDGIWLTKYSAVISAFAKDMLHQGKEVVLVINESYLNVLKKRYENLDNVESVFFNKLNELPMMTEINPLPTLSFQDEDIPDSLFQFLLS